MMLIPRRWYNAMTKMTDWLGRTLLVMSLALASLQVFHMVLLDRLNNQLNTVKIVHFLEKDVQMIMPIIKDSLENSHIMDSSGEYRIVYNVLKSNGSQHDDVIQRRYGVTLVSQCSFNHIHYIIDLSHQWQGPLSVAVFIPQQYSKIIIESLMVLHYCIPHLRHNISLHLVYALRPSMISVGVPDVIPEVLNCDDFHQILDRVLQEQLKPIQNYDHGLEKYPNNLLRNVASRYVQTDYVLVTDIDIVPSSNLYKNFVDFARKSSFSSETASLDAQTSYVIPVFEVERGTEVPINKETLIHLWQHGTIRPFYSELCWKCQKHTDYSMWKNLSRSISLTAPYVIEWKDPWEPFYIAPRRTIPQYDERFKQFGFNRISQVCEAHIAGFKFAILNNAFLTHLGFKTQEGFHHSKETEQEHNRKLFRRFKEDLKTKYPQSSRRCY